MSRLISMEDAIRAIEEEWDGCCSEYPATQIIYDTTEAIERLPIIQPEITHEQAVEYLQSTGWMQEHDRQMMLDGYRKGKEDAESHWIPVTERLPETHKSVLVWSGGYICQDMIVCPCDDKIWYRGGKIKDSDAWMPLTPTPQMTESEETI